MSAHNDRIPDKARDLWGIALLFRDGTSTLINSDWHRVVTERGAYHDEPTRTLLFCTREAARAWVRDYRKRNRTWTLRPVRVRETVRATGRAT